MNTVNQREVDLGGVVWESEDGSTVPAHEESVYREQKAIQFRISEHQVIDKDKDWSDISFKPTQKVDESKISKGRNRFANKRTQGPRPNASNFKSENDLKLKRLNQKHYLQFLDLTICAVGAVFEFLFIILLHIFGIKKFRKTRRRKTTISKKSSKRRARPLSKKYSANRKSTVSSKSRLPVLNWKEVEAKFVPSSNLYCYWCTKKLGLKSWELDGHYYCDYCHSSKNVNLQ